MSRPLFYSLLFASTISLATDFKIVDAGDPDSGEPLQHLKKVVKKKGDTSFFANKAIHLAVFDAEHFSLKVIDNGAGDSAKYTSLATAMQENFCPAGVNGGFFLKNYAPSGLQIAEGKREGKFGTAKLLSGVVFADNRERIYLMRRQEFRDDAVITDLIQSGPFLVDGGKAVAGLSKENARRRTFVLTDGKSKWALGYCDSMTLSDLGTVLAMGELFPEIKIVQALNLDGGTSTGFYFDKGAGISDVSINPIKRVRNFVGITPR